MSIERLSFQSLRSRGAQCISQSMSNPKTQKPQRGGMSIASATQPAPKPQRGDMYVGIIFVKVHYISGTKILYPLRPTLKKRSVCRCVKGEKRFTPFRYLLCELQRLAPFRGMGDTYLVRERRNKCVALVRQYCGRSPIFAIKSRQE